MLDSDSKHNTSSQEYLDKKDMFQTFKPQAYTAPVGGQKSPNSNLTPNGTPAPIGDESQLSQQTEPVTIPTLEEDETMNIWLEKVENISKNDPDWMDLSSDSIAATVFATQYLIQSLTQDSLLLSSYRQSQLTPGHQLPPPELTLNYNDIADCISIKDQYSFLSDMIPRTKNLKDLVRENKIRYTTFVNNDQVQDIDINNSTNNNNNNLVNNNNNNGDETEEE
ncbi:protein Dls1p [Monosporozyma unispora]|nr:DNA-directed DNA polymerase epsilon, subunit C [Kazachstania unispora]